MTAPIGPDDNPHTSQNADPAGQQGHSFDNPGTAEYDPAYIPEREFVLMPLFRRIGDLLGIRRRREEPEYVYEPEPLAPPVNASAAAETEPVVTAWSAQSETEWTDSSVPLIRSEARDLQTEDISREKPWREELPSEGLLGIERVTWSEPSAIQEMAAEPEPDIVAHSEGLASAEPEPSPPVDQQLAPEPERPTQPLEAASPFREPQPEIVYSPTSAEELKNLVAPLRQAAEKISAVISEAADWLHSKEQEILKRAELPLEQANSTPQEAQSAAAMPPFEDSIADLPAEAHATFENASTSPDHGIVSSESPASVSPWPTEAPALQRELAWRIQRTESLPNGRVESPVSSIQQPAPAETNRRKPHLIPVVARVPLWRRIDLGQQFTPKRVAVLGGLAMAVLMFLGISIARRPASSVLPQQQTRSIPPGGVTLNTHPAGAPRARSANAAAPHSTTPARKPAQRSATRYQEPDVVTHYYTNAKQKPSPAKQATVAGVRHYSDMQ